MLPREKIAILLTQPSLESAFIASKTYLTYVVQIDDMKVKSDGSDTYEIIPGEHTIHFFMCRKTRVMGMHEFTTTRLLIAKFNAKAGRTYLIDGYSLREKDKLAPWVYVGVRSDGKRKWAPLPNVQISATD